MLRSLVGSEMCIRDRITTGFMLIKYQQPLNKLQETHETLVDPNPLNPNPRDPHERLMDPSLDTGVGSIDHNMKVHGADNMDLGTAQRVLDTSAQPTAPV
eukprot:TRINITY_DN25823_c0_g1_i2.p1 TRINITY_DN25823_c0_g1~~TRINITY_DN25823_c0_g1_i2.p1  ORF type:complete len:100 (+),score=26.86 TRINITY_DN25823_c0_g1_i2:141-440(+)